MASGGKPLLLLLSCLAALLNGGACGWPPVPKLAKAVQCLSLNRTGLLLEPGYNCTKMLDWFAEVYTALIGCFLENAHPTCLCEACLPFYLEVQNIYSTIHHWDSNHDGAAKHYVAGHRCTDSLLYGSKLGVLQSALGFAKSLWQSAACECCIRNGTTVNDSTVLTPAALEFYWHLENLTRCTAEYAVIAEDLRNNASPVTQSPTPLPVPHTGRSNLSNLSVCSACLPQYQQLLTYYDQYKKDIESKGCTVCADIADHINKTRLQWSGVFGCGRMSVNMATVVGLAMAVLTLPVFFYVGAFLCGELKGKRQRNLPPCPSHSSDDMQHMKPASDDAPTRKAASHDASAKASYHATASASYDATIKTASYGGTKLARYGATDVEPSGLSHRVNSGHMGD